MYQVVGQSYSVAYGVAAGKGAAQLLAAFLEEEEQNYGVVGAVLCYSKVAGGYATVANKLVRNSATYLRGTDYGVVWFGGNDLFCMDSTFSAASQAHLKSVFRFAISRMCAGKIYDDEDASITYSGFSKSAELGESKVTGKFTHFATANGSKVTINVPASFPGGTVAVYLNGENSTGGTWTFKVDGAAAGELSTKYSYGVTALSMFCKRFTGLAPGAHTIVLTVNSITTYAAFDSWAIEAPVPPTVIVPGQFKLNAYAAGETHTPNDGDIEALEKLIKEACEEFGPYVKFVSLSSFDHTTHVQADKLHPDAQLHEEIFDRFVATLEAEEAPEEHSGSSSVSGGGSLSSSGSKTAGGSSTLSDGGSIASSGGKLVFGSSSLAGGGSLSSSGFKRSAAASALSGGGASSSSGSKEAKASSAISGGGDITSTGSGGESVRGSSRISGGGSLSSSGRKEARDSSRVSGGGGQTSAARALRSGVSTVSGGGRISSEGHAGGAETGHHLTLTLRPRTEVAFSLHPKTTVDLTVGPKTELTLTLGDDGQ